MQEDGEDPRDERSFNRRRFLLAAAAGTAGLALWSSRPSSLGEGGHPDYFRRLAGALRAQGIGRPAMLVDLDRLDRNVDAVVETLGPRALRVVAKSLPSPRLIDYVLRRAGSDRVMGFHQPFLNEVARSRPDVDLLLGKPMPVAAANRFYERLAPGAFDPALQLQWLIDTPERLRQYASLAEARAITMRVNIEVDVGLHRGGVVEPASLAGMLEQVRRDPRLELAGLMGYDPHVVKVPGLPGAQAREFARVQDRYRGFLDIVESSHGKAATASSAATFNAAGSPTYRLWQSVDGLATELSVGSGFVKPLDFDLPTLEEHVPALFIATPVLKATDGLAVPGLGSANALWSAWDPNRARTFFTYGGYWKAHPVSPPGLVVNPLFGRSTNQEMLNGAQEVDLEVDDYVFLRPTQSEFVMLQFGDLLIVRDGNVVDRWDVFDESGKA